MQTLKEEISQRILDAARDEFYDKGYEGSSIRTIAAKADITPGNIYRYFPSKEELLNAILEPCFAAFRNRFKAKEDIPLSTVGPQELSEYLLHVLERYPKEIQLIIDNPNVDRIRDFFIEHIRRRMIRDMHSEEILAKVLARNLVESVYAILDECHGDKVLTQRLLMKLFSIAFVDTVRTGLYE